MTEPVAVDPAVKLREELKRKILERERGANKIDAEAANPTAPVISEGYAVPTVRCGCGETMVRTDEPRRPQPNTIRFKVRCPKCTRLVIVALTLVG